MTAEAVPLPSDDAERPLRDAVAVHRRRMRTGETLAEVLAAVRAGRPEPPQTDASRRRMLRRLTAEPDCEPDT